MAICYHFLKTNFLKPKINKQTVTKLIISTYREFIEKQFRVNIRKPVLPSRRVASNETRPNLLELNYTGLRRLKYKVLSYNKLFQDHDTL